VKYINAARPESDGRGLGGPGGPDRSAELNSLLYQEQEQEPREHVQENVVNAADAVRLYTSSGAVPPGYV
jgi:hypothetical protein